MGYKDYQFFTSAKFEAHGSYLSIEFLLLVLNSPELCFPYCTLSRTRKSLLHSTHPESDSEYISKSEVIILLQKFKSSIRVSVNVCLFL